MTPMTVSVGTKPLTIDDVGAIAERRAIVTLSPDGREAVRKARAVVDRLVDEKIPAYGITTGVGSQKDFSVDPDAIARYNDLMITAHATLAPGRNASPQVVRAALAIQLSLFARGRSGVRLELVESLVARLTVDAPPAARPGMYAGPSDTVALSQMAVPLIGRAGAQPGGHGPAPLEGLTAKEAVSLLNSNSLMLAEGVLAIREQRALLDAATLAGAMSMEGLRGNLRSWGEKVDQARGQPGQIRAGAHTDYGSLTILLPQAGSRGLEIIAPNGEWTPVPPVPGAFVINIGDLMARWTNDRWVSTVHRVVNPPAQEGGRDRRQSMAFFHQPNWHAEIKVLDVCLAAGEAPKYEPVLSGPYLMGKFKATTK